MITIINERGTGKAKELLAQARANNAIVVTQNKKAFIVKAKSYGYEDVEIIDYDDLNNSNYTICKPVLIHNGDEVLKYLMDIYYALNVIGFSATKEGE